jgi:polyisoprenoid-binding protein YceI
VQRSAKWSMKKETSEGEPFGLAFTFPISGNSAVAANERIGHSVRKSKDMSTFRRLHPRFKSVLTLCAVAITASSTVFVNVAPAASAPKAGGVCKKQGQVSGSLICTKKASRLVWAKKPATPTTVAKAGTTVASAPPTSAASTATTAGIEGTWKATSASTVGYRVKEVLDGQSIEAVGRTNAVTGLLTIVGTSVTDVDLVVDVTKLESDQGRRDAQVQGRILETSKFPTAKLKLKAPIALGKIPADGEIIEVKAKITLTIKAVTKDVDVDIKARRNGANVEVNGAIPITWADWGIVNPSLPPLVTTEDKGLLEFIVVFGR